MLMFCWILQPNVVTAKDAKQVLVQNAYPLLIINNAPIKEDLAKVLSSSHAFAIVQSDKNVLSYPGIIEVASFTYNTQKYSILRRVSGIF